jgi:uncharacterized protein YcnI
MYKKIFALPLLAGLSLLFASQALAHATVKPAEVGVGKYQNFTVAVPSEKPIATIGIRLVIPEGINSATPNVKPGWKIEKKNQATGNKTEDEGGMTVDEQRLVEIIWTGGNIPAGQRDEFIFSTKVPSKPTTLNWKVYQTYADGTVVAWEMDPDQQPKDAGGKADFSSSGPYSMTKVIDDLSSSSTVSTAKDDSSKTSNIHSTTALILSIIAVAVSISAKRGGKK